MSLSFLINKFCRLQTIDSWDVLPKKVQRKFYELAVRSEDVVGDNIVAKKVIEIVNEPVRYKCNKIIGKCMSIKTDIVNPLKNDEYFTLERCNKKCFGILSTGFMPGVAQNITGFLGEDDKDYNFLTYVTGRVYPHRGKVNIKNVRKLSKKQRKRVTNLMITTKSQLILITKPGWLEKHFPNVDTLHISVSIQYESLPYNNIPIKVKTIIIRDNNFNVNLLPDHIEVIRIFITSTRPSRAFTRTIGNLPANLRVFQLSDVSRMENQEGGWNHSVSDLPDNLEELIISADSFNSNLYHLPQNLKKLTIISSILNQPLDMLPENLQELYISGILNDISENLPQTLKVLRLTVFMGVDILNIPNSVVDLEIDGSKFQDDPNNWPAIGFNRTIYLPHNIETFRFISDEDEGPLNLVNPASLPNISLIIINDDNMLISLVEQIMSAGDHIHIDYRNG